MHCFWISEIVDLLRNRISIFVQFEFYTEVLKPREEYYYVEILLFKKY